MVQKMWYFHLGEFQYFEINKVKHVLLRLFLYYIMDNVGDSVVSLLFQRDNGS